MSIEFDDRSFCFTGTLTDLKRSQAQREVRARGGLTMDQINERLDFLVVGDTPSPGWKHGAYGTKIEKARGIREAGGARPRLVPESDFMLALAETPMTNTGAVDGKVFVGTYKFVVRDLDTLDQDTLSAALEQIAEEQSCHICGRARNLSVAKDLYVAGTGGEGVVLEYRFVRQAPLAWTPTDFIEQIERAFESMSGVDGRLSWFERAEGSADYVRLMAEVPPRLRIPGL